MKKLVLLLLFSCLLISFVSAVDVTGNDTFVFNSSLLPVNGSFNLELTVVPNETVFLSLLSNDANISFFYEDNYSTNSSLLNLSVPFTVNTLNIFSDEYFNTTFLINNTFSNVSLYYTLFFNIVFDESVNTGDNGAIFYVSDGGTQGINISDNFLPVVNHSYSYELLGVKGDNVSVSCSEWFVCPEIIFFGDDNVSRFEVFLSIPETVSMGNYSLFVNFSNSVINRSTVFPVNIYESSFSYDVFVFTDDCYHVGSDGSKYLTLDCAERMTSYYRAVSDEALEYYRNYEFPTCENITVTEYVLSGNVEDDFRDLYDKTVIDRDTCLADKSVLSSDKGICQSNLASTNNDLSNCQDDLFIARGESLDTSFNEKTACLDAIDQAMKDVKSKNKRFAWRVFFCLLGVLLFVLFILLVRHIRSKKLE